MAGSLQVAPLSLVEVGSLSTATTPGVLVMTRRLGGEMLSEGPLPTPLFCIYPQIVLSGLKKPLCAYDSFDVTLVFEKAGQAKIEVLVEEAAEPNSWKAGG